MRKFLALVGVLFLCFTLGACSNGQPETKKTYDNDFITAVGKGLEDRSILISQSDAKNLNAAESREVILKGIKGEIQGIKYFMDKEFVNPELKKISEDYMKQLEIQEKNYMYFEDINNYEKAKVFHKAYNERTKLIKTMIDKYGLKLNDALTKEFTSNAKKVNSKELVDTSIIESLKNATFKKESYKIVGNVKNVSGEAITGRTINVKLINKEGVTVANEQYYIDGTWENNEIRAIEFFNSDNKNYDKMEFSISE